VFEHIAGYNQVETVFSALFQASQGFNTCNCFYPGDFLDESPRGGHKVGNQVSIVASEAQNIAESTEPEIQLIPEQGGQRLFSVKPSFFARKRSIKGLRIPRLEGMSHPLILDAAIARIKTNFLESFEPRIEEDEPTVGTLRKSHRKGLSLPNTLRQKRCNRAQTLVAKRSLAN
jgi:hypothetical protein